MEAPTAWVDDAVSPEGLVPAAWEGGNTTGDGIFARKSKAGSGSTGIDSTAISKSAEGGGPPPWERFRERFGGILSEDGQIVSTAQMSLY